MMNQTAVKTLTKKDTALDPKARLAELVTPWRVYLTTLILYLCLSAQVFGQSLSPVPDPAGTRFFYKDTTGRLRSVAVAGSFNDWDKKRSPMRYDANLGCWSGTAAATAGIEYHYKLVLNDSLWITDPNAPDVTEDEWRNSIIVPQEYGKPYILRSYPPLNKRVLKADTVTIQLASPNSTIDHYSIKIKFNSKITGYSYNKHTQTVTFAARKLLREGENKVELTFADISGKRRDNAVIKFFYDIGLDRIETPRYFDSAVVCEVFIRSFMDSNNDGIGDFNGLTSRLGYLHDTLGVNVLWLMPFQESTTDHGYNVVDYYSIEKDYGTITDYRAFLKECKKRNIKVLLDFVINHTDSTHPFFLNAYKNPGSKYSSWYQFTNRDNSDWYHFGVERKMPKLDFENPAVRQYFVDAAMYWLDPDGDGRGDDGVDGFRCDAAKEVPHSFWNMFRKEVKSRFPQTLLLGEVWDNANYVIPFFKNEFDALFNYPLLYSLDEYINHNSISQFVNRNMEFGAIYPAGYQMVNFLANHDNDRSASRYSTPEKLSMALFAIFTLPGTPMLYYGDEIGMRGQMPPENVRKVFEWDRLRGQMDDKNSILNYYRALTRLRKSVPCLAKRNDRDRQSLKFVDAEGSGLLCYYRFDESGKYLVVINNSGVRAGSITVPYPFEGRGPETALKIADSRNNIYNGSEAVSFSFAENKIIFGSINLESNNFLLIKLR